MQTALRLASYRANSEDRCAFHECEQGLLVVVADGAGGLPHAGPAATRASQLVVEHFYAAESATRLDAEAWATLLPHIDEQLVRDPHCGETTLVALYVEADRIVGTSTGDSGALLLGASGEVVDVTEAQRRHHRLGQGFVLPACIDLPFHVGDTLLVASDGLLNYAARDKIVACMRNPDLQYVADALVELVRTSSGGFADDLSIALVRRGEID